MAKDRITIKRLEALCLEINRALGTPEAAYTRQADGKMVANIGNVHLDEMYGAVSVVQMDNERGGVSVVIPAGTRREVYERGRAYLDGVRDGRARQ